MMQRLMDNFIIIVMSPFSAALLCIFCLSCPSRLLTAAAQNADFGQSAPLSPSQKKCVPAAKKILAVCDKNEIL
jgi:hypothetical protein